MNKTINCTETSFTVDHIKTTLNGKAIDFKRAGLPGSEHEALLLRRIAAQPTYTLNPITPKKNLNKKTYAGLSRDLMRAYIPTQEHAEERMAELDEFEAKDTNFPTIKSWFLDTYKDFSVEEAKRAISKNKITNVKKAAVIKLKSKKTVDFAKAGNQ